MTIADPVLAASFQAILVPQQLLGPDGRVLGLFYPAIPGMSIPESGLTDAELDAIAAEPKCWVTAAEVEARLRSLS